MNKKIIVVDGQGGKIGKLLITQLKKEKAQYNILAIGTNSIATSNMLKAGADKGATGENPIIVNVKDADIIIGPMGIVIPNSLLGEITPKMAEAIGSSKAYKILLPIEKCNTYIAGSDKSSLTELVKLSIQRVIDIIDEKN